MDDSRLITYEHLANWSGKLYSLENISPSQEQAVRNFAESCNRYINRRADLHLTSIQFHEATRLNRTTMDIQSDFYYRTEVLFQGFYSCLSQFANVAFRFKTSLSIDLSASSNEKFLKSISAGYPELLPTCKEIDLAREHRNFLDHPVSNQVSNWMTTSTGDERILMIVHFGDMGRSGNIPVGAIKGRFGPQNCEWHKFTPNHFTIENELKTLINYVLDKINSLIK